MDFKDLIKQRRSIRTFTPESITPEEERLLLRAALMAPSSKGKHSYYFKVVRDRAQLQALAACRDAGTQLLAEAPMAIVVMADPAITDIWVEDCASATSYILLQAEDMGLGGCWVQVRSRAKEDGTAAQDTVKQVLSIPDEYQVLSMVAVGHKAIERNPQNEDKLPWDHVL